MAQMSEMSRLRAGLALALGTLVLLAGSSCGRKGAGSGAAAGVPRGDSLFLAEAPAVIPEDAGPAFDAAGIGSLYVTAATLGAGGAVRSFPPPPTSMPRPVVLVVNADPALADTLARTEPKDAGAIGQSWLPGLQRLVAEAKPWAQVRGVHIHFLPAPASARSLAAALEVVKKGLPGLSVSVTIPSSSDLSAWKPLAGVVDEALVFCFGRRPETGDVFLPELTEAAARTVPLPFRLLVVLGGYGRAGSSFAGRRIPDREIDQLTEDRNLDFDFSAVLSTEPGSIYTFKPRPGYDWRKSLLAADGGYARFHILPMSDLVRFLTDASRWSGTKLAGRVFVVDAVPRDGHLVGFEALQAFLTGKPWDPNLNVEVESPKAGSFTLRITNTGPTSSELSRFGNWIQVRVEGGAFANVAAGDFDRYELYLSASDMTQLAPFGRATVCRLFENFFAPGESNEAGPLRVSGAHPRAFLSYELALPDGRVLKVPELEVSLVPEVERKEPPVRLGRSRRR